MCAHTQVQAGDTHTSILSGGEIQTALIPQPLLVSQKAWLRILFFVPGIQSLKGTPCSPEALLSHLGSRPPDSRAGWGNHENNRHSAVGPHREPGLDLL